MRTTRYQVCAIESLDGRVTQKFAASRSLTKAIAEGKAIIKAGGPSTIIVRDIVTGDDLWKAPHAVAIRRELEAYWTTIAEHAYPNNSGVREGLG